MSQRKIKTGNKPKKPQPIKNMKSITDMGLHMKRIVRKEDENAEVVALITEDKLDLLQQNDYKYMKTLAMDINWSIDKLFKVTRRVTELLKEEEKEKKK